MTKFIRRLIEELQKSFARMWLEVELSTQIYELLEGQWNVEQLKEEFPSINTSSLLD